MGNPKEKSNSKDDQHFKVLAVRTLPFVNDSDSVDKQKKMYKVLKENTTYAFYQNFRYNRKDGTIEYDVSNDTVEQLYDIKETKEGKEEPKLCVSISAIVGANGSGKSTLIELMIRVINNLAVMLIGEGFISPGAEHLHYIDHVYASLYALIGKEIIEIEVRNNEVIVYKYIKEGNSKTWKKDASNGDTYSLKPKGYYTPTNQEKSKESLEKYFYSIVTNYSIYAFNTSDYEDEKTDNEKLKKIDGGRNLIDFDDPEICYWLKGLFHKNDGYLTPIVINPKRTQGNYDINTENALARERLMAVIHHAVQHIGEQQYFYTINGKFETKRIRISSPGAQDYRYLSLGNKKSQYYKYAPERTRFTLGFFNKNLKMNMKINDFKNLNKIIKEEAEKIFETNMDENKNVRKNKPMHYDEAMQYIVYKILKITKQYKQYNRWYRTFKNYRTGKAIKKEVIRLLLILINDHTHLTRKLWQTVFYLKFQLLSGSIPTEGQKKEIDLLGSVEKCRNCLDIYKNKKQYEGKNTYVIPDDVVVEYDINPQELLPAIPFYLEELLPPPIFQVDILLFDKVNNVENINFNTLSSGEKQVTHTISSFLYHLVNLDSVEERPWGPYIERLQGNREDRIIYKHINAVFDEVEMYFHPEMQRLFIKELLNCLSQMPLNSIQGINIMLITHSPFILSDIPKSNVLFLEKEGTISSQEQLTFAANVHDILRSSFFLKDGFIGEYAKSQIQNIATAIKDCNKNESKLSQEQYEHFKAIIEIIGEPLIRNKLMMMIQDVYDDQKTIIDEHIALLEKDIERLKKEKNRKGGDHVAS
ncbi:MAG: hypothetical protein LBN06_02860 [Prevotellaceae bacterium]|jgi:predicted ATP-binding protein involved in virulence|nr:hypothetical protein [Prevotellaceae bacterium]